MMLIEAQIIWNGGISVDELKKLFEVSRKRAENAFQIYQQRCPKNVQVSADGEIYSATDRFEPMFLRGTVQEFLQVLRNFGKTAATPLSIVAAQSAPIELLEAPEREFDVRILQRITTAIRDRRTLAIQYQSMTHPEARTLEICPHALAHTGRWHMRAWSHTHQAYRDFLLSRLAEIPELKAKAEVPADKKDWEWDSLVSVKIGAHPQLSAGQKAVIEKDYGMRGGVLEKTVRVAMIPYYLRLMNVGDDDHMREPATQQIVLLNKQAVEGYDRLKKTEGAK